MEHCNNYFLNILVPWTVFRISMLLLCKNSQLLKKSYSISGRLPGWEVRSLGLAAFLDFRRTYLALLSGTSRNEAELSISFLILV